MAHYTTEERTITMPDGHELYTKTWTPTTPAKARIVFLHGFSDHSEMHAPFFQNIAKHGIKSYALDQRGWGKSVHSPREKGLSGPSSQIMDDITHMINSLPQESDIPLFLMGHSMGGGEVLYYAAEGPKETRKHIRGFLASAPWIGLHESSRPWKSTVAIGRLVGKLLPHRQMVNKLDAEKLCRDPDVCKKWKEDPLCHDTGTLEGFAAAFDRGSALEEGKAKIKDGEGEGGKTRVWVGSGTGDLILDHEMTRSWYENNLKVEDREFHTYEGWYHNLDIEPGEDKITFANDVSKWILDRSGPLESLGGRSKL